MPVLTNPQIAAQNTSRSATRMLPPQTLIEKTGRNLITDHAYLAFFHRAILFPVLPELLVVYLMLQSKKALEIVPVDDSKRKTAGHKNWKGKGWCTTSTMVAVLAN